MQLGTLNTKHELTRAKRLGSKRPTPSHRICFLVIVFWSFLVDGHSQTRENPSIYDTIFVGPPNRTIKIAFDIGLPSPPALDIGTKDYAGRVLGCCDVILKALVPNPAPTSLYIRYGEKYYSGTIAYKENLSIDDEVLDFRKQVGLPDPINENRAITTESPSLEMQQIARHMGILEGKTKDRINTIATLKERLTFKLADIMQDDNFLYFKFILINDSKIIYKIDFLDFLYRHTKSEKEYRQATPMSHNNITSVTPKSSRTLIYVLPKFTMTPRWQLQVSLREHSGTRRLDLTIPFEKIDSSEKY